MTLDEMIQQCASDIDEILTKNSSGAYEGDDLVLARKIVTGINYAYQKIAREKHILTLQETVTLDADLMFTQTALTQPVVKLFNVYDAYREPVYWIPRNQTSVLCPDECEGRELTAEYSYLPPRLLVTALSDSPLFPENRVDHMIMCYYADFYVLSLEPDNETREKAATFLALYNDGFVNIRQEISEYMTMRVE